MLKKAFLDGINTVGVVGAGKSGLSACRLLSKLGRKVRLSEKGFLSPEAKNALYGLNVDFEENGHNVSFFSGCELVITSPGVDFYSDFIQKVINSGIPVVGEIELAFWFCPAPIIAVTGTNGKTTVTRLIAEALRLSGRKVYELGNIGVPFSSKVLEIGPDDIVCLEASSFQLESIKYFRPYIACFLNIAGDHLDRHKDFSAYFNAKKNIFASQTEEDYAVFPEELAEDLALIKAKKIIVKKSSGGLNREFALAVAKIWGLPLDKVKGRLSGFEGLPHRLEKIKTVNGVEFYNDSKATNPASTVWALERLGSRVILIAGGRDKGMDFSPINSCCRQVKKLILLGEAASKIKSVFKDNNICLFADSLQQALSLAFSCAAAGDKVVLSPMCASFDMFKNYEERGDLFKEYVRSL